MKKYFLFLLATALLSTPTFAASPAATQSWVRNYVATNAAPISGESVYIAPTTVTVYNDDGEAETVTFNWVRNTNDAFRVTASACTGVTNGLTFARIGDMRYYNATNYACPLITGAVECVRILYTSAVDRVIGTVTNTVYTGTNYVYDIVYHTTIGSTPFSSVKIADGLYCLRPDVTNSPYGFFYLTHCKISDITYRKIITLPTVRIKRRPSLFELLFPSAHAGWGEPVGMGVFRYDPENPRPNETYYIYEKTERHYYTDDDAATFSLGTVEWLDANGNKVSYTIDYTFPFSIAAGQDLCNANLTKADMTEAQLASALEGVLPKVRYLWITKSSTAWNAVCNAAATQLESYNSTVDSYANISCPEYDWKLVGSAVGECVNHVWRGTCGSWKCAICQESKTEPSEHSFVTSPDADKCDHCTNMADEDDPYSECGGKGGYRPGGIDHHRGWHDDGIGHDKNCVCECYTSESGKHGYALSHQDPVNSSETNVWADAYLQDPTTTNCWRTWTCLRCKSNNANTSLVTIDQPGVTATKTDHLSNQLIASHYSCDKDYHVVSTASDGVYCREDFTCDHLNENDERMRKAGCGATKSTYLDHIVDESYGKNPVVKEGDYAYHYETFPCGNGFYGWNNPTNDIDHHWCGWTTNMLYAHSWARGGNGPQVVKDGEESPYPPTNAGHWYYDICGDLKTGETNGPHQCKMENKRFEAHKPLWGNDGMMRGNPSPSGHDLTNKCYACDKLYLYGTEAHDTNQSVFVFFNNISHVYTNFCTSCTSGLEDIYPNGYPFGMGSEYHSTGYIAGEKAVKYGDGNSSYHFVSNYCDECDHWYRTLEMELHGDQSYINKRIDGSYKFLGQSEVDIAGTHLWSNHCQRCDVVYKGGEEDCDKNGTWTLNDLTNGYDSVTCSKCGGTSYFNHRWTPFYYTAGVSQGHYCPNGGGHLFIQPHVWEDPTTSNRCVLCEYEPTPTPVTEHVCKDECGCKSSSCLYGLQDNGDGTYTCKCPKCLAGQGDECECCWKIYKLCLTDYPHVTTKKFKDAFVGSSYRWIDLDDPVYQIDESGFEGAFSNSLSLVKFTANALTNAGKKAFAYALKGCTSLKSISFDNLEYAGESSFSYFASDTPNQLTAVSFPKLKHIGAAAFRQAFYNNPYLTSASFPALTDIDERYAFNSTFYGTPIQYLDFSSVTNGSQLSDMEVFANNSLKKVKLSRIESVYGFMFGDGTKLGNLEEVWLDKTPIVCSCPFKEYAFFAPPWYTCVFVATNQLASYKASSDWSLAKENLYAVPASDSMIVKCGVYNMHLGAMDNDWKYNLKITNRIYSAGNAVNGFVSLKNLASGTIETYANYSTSHGWSYSPAGYYAYDDLRSETPYQLVYQKSDGSLIEGDILYYPIPALNREISNFKCYRFIDSDYNYDYFYAGTQKGCFPVGTGTYKKHWKLRHVENDLPTYVDVNASNFYDQTSASAYQDVFETPFAFKVSIAPPTSSSKYNTMYVDDLFIGGSVSSYTDYNDVSNNTTAVYNSSDTTLTITIPCGKVQDLFYSQLTIDYVKVTLTHGGSSQTLSHDDITFTVPQTTKTDVFNITYREGAITIVVSNLLSVTSGDTVNVDWTRPGSWNQLFNKTMTITF